MKFINSVLALLAAISLALAVAVPNPVYSLGECVPGDSACRGYDLFHCSFIRPYYYEFARTCHKQCVEVDDRNAMCRDSHLQVVSRQESSEYQQQQQSREQSAAQCIPGSTICRGTFVYQCINLHSFNFVPYMTCEKECVSEDFQHAHCKAADDEVEEHQKEKEHEMNDHQEQEQQELVECYPGERVCVGKELLQCTITHPYTFNIASHCPGICIEANITPPNRSASCGSKGEVLRRILPRRERCVPGVAVCKGKDMLK
ncbi:hypothetical protein BS50DRAFT_266784 [Corynespora cassiicola Philippines]|uniref:ShKT domain-containing protein n=1 Tax=Corynespora cassiicola Philippines TaxID=1448308 RepID=A0A2T2P041_CORCC|nr:hypothetical protein BS50DRAFT_266784 [Corynespora cassiicola Philippines]